MCYGYFDDIGVDGYDCVVQTVNVGECERVHVLSEFLVWCGRVGGSSGVGPCLARVLFGWSITISSFRTNGSNSCGQARGWDGVDILVRVGCEILYRRLKTTGWLVPFARHDYCVSW
jgi:hypothetical protein